MRPIAPPRFVSIVLAALGLALLPACGAKKKSPSTASLLSAVGAYRKGMEQLSHSELRQAIATLDRIQYTAETQERIEPLSRLAVADATFYGGTDLALIDARNLYLDFVTLYGDHPLAPYAETQAGMCSLLQISHPSRDQTLTYQALADLQEVRRRYPDSRFSGVADGLIRTARSNLAESEFVVGRFYLKQKRPLAALERFDRITSEYPDYEQMDKVLFYMGTALVKLDNDVKARLYLEQIVRDWPSGSYGEEARKLLTQLEPPPDADGEASR
jgi:outer membrane protein assembly factor BamD